MAWEFPSLVLAVAEAVPPEAHGGGWIDDFGIVLAAAGLAVALFYRLGFPVLFGYILAGLLIGPHLLPRPLVEDAEAIEQISELGIIFLLFFIGMEFDLKRLKRVLGPAFLALLLQTLFMLYLSQLLATLLGWNPAEALFFGSLLAISSSMVTVRVLREGKRLQDASAQFTIGILILEDVLAVILLVILTGVAVTQTLDWDAAWLITFLMGIFVIMVFVIGRAIVPRLLLAVSGDETEPEVITLVSVGLVMGISILALRLNFSPALGAFVAGTLLSQTQVAQKVERINRSLHDVFSAVFFVSIGMLLDPLMLVSNLPWILAISLTVIVGKIGTCWLGLALAGESGRTAFMASVPKAQIGEFSFIIAGLGSSLGVMDPVQTGIAFGVAMVTILLTPFSTALSGRTFNILQGWVPRRMGTLFETYRKFLEGLSHGLDRSILLRLIRRPILQVVLYVFLIIGLFISASAGARPFMVLAEEWPMDWIWKLVYWIGVALVLSPFLLAVLRNLNALSYILTDALFNSRSSRPIYQNRLRQMLSNLIFGLFLLVLAMVFLLLGAPYIPNTAIAGMGFLVAAAAVFFLRGRLILVNSQMEVLFMDSFREEVASKEEERRAEVLAMIHEQVPWPVEVVDLTLPRHAAWSGKLIRELNLRGTYGVTILALGRGHSMVYDPAPDAVVFSGDRLVLTGSKDNLERVREDILVQIKPEDRFLPGPSRFLLEQVYVTPGTELDGETLAGARVRQRYGVTVIGVQRGEERILNPLPDFLVDAGDVLLVAGVPEKIKAFAATCCQNALPSEH
ncbi:MAG: cation:proton antiporter [Oceanipulchritudo sp.]